MELTYYLRLIFRHWLSFAIGAIITMAVGAMLILPRPDVFEAKGTYVIRPTSADAADAVRAFDTLIRGVEINATYAAIARSDIIRDRARAQLAAESDLDLRGLDVGAEVVTGTNIISISVRGEDPEAAAVYADYIGRETVEYVTELRDGFQIELLDPPSAPRSPVGPNRQLDLALTIILGLGVGTSLAIGVEAWRRQASPFPELNVIDTKTGLYNDAFFKLRVEQELDSAKRSGRPLSLGMIRVAQGDPWEGNKPLSDPEELRLVSSAPADDARSADVVSYLGDGTLAIVMPDVDLPRAREVLAEWVAWIKPRLTRNGSRPFNVGSGACEFGEDWIICDDQIRELVDRVIGEERASQLEPTAALTK